MGFSLFKKKKKDKLGLPVAQKNYSESDIMQQRKNAKYELDKIDIDAMKAERNARKHKLKASERRAKIDGIFDSIDSALSVVSDKPLKNPAGTAEPKKKKSGLDDPFGEPF